MLNGYRALVLIVLLLFLSCSVEKPVKIPELPETGQVIIPDSGRENRTQYKSDTESELVEKRENLVPSIPIGANWKVIRLLDVNLDGDTDEEQIIILEPVNGENSSADSLEIWIADYSGGSSSYELSWKGELTSRLEQSLSVQVNESHDQGLFEIYVTGYQENDYHCLDVLYPLSPLKPNYRKIFSRSVKGTIELFYPEIAGSSLSDDYGTRVRVSPEIIITQTDLESDNPLDSLVTTWELSSSPPRYKMVSQRKIVVSQEQEAKLLELINGSIEDFEELLGDYWFKEETGDEVIRMIHLDRDLREIQFISLQDFERYSWDSSHKSSYLARLYIYGTSLYISSIRKELAFDVVDTDTINLIVYDNGRKHKNLSWTGGYKRMTQGMKDSLIKQFSRELNMEAFDLKGRYKNPSGDELFFDTNRFILNREEEKETGSGYFSLFKLNGVQLIELIYYDKQGIKTKREIYSFDHSVEDDREHRIRSFNLVPGQVDVKGFSPSEDRGSRYEQIELLSTGESSGTEATAAPSP